MRGSGNGRSAPHRSVTINLKRPRAAASGVALPRSRAVVGLAAEGEAVLPAAAVPQAITVPQETAKIKLDTAKLSPAQMLELLTRVVTGMASVPGYATLPVMADLQGARTALSTLLTNLAALETQLKEARITLGQWLEACRAVVDRAAVACEAENPDPASLVTGGWKLRRGRGPSHAMPPPTGLNLKQTGFAGEGVARWRSVPNAKYYEVQMDPVPGAALTIAESVLLTSGRVKIPLPPVAPGSLVTLCVRAVGAKGAGPFCDALTVRVN